MTWRKHKKTTALIPLLLLCAHGLFINAQETANPFIKGINDLGLNDNPGGDIFSVLQIDSGGTCSHYSGACTALFEDFTFFDGNPAASSIIYSGPFIGFSHINSYGNNSMQSVAFVHSIENFGFGAMVRYGANILNRFNSIGEVESIFSTSYIDLGLNLSYNFFRELSVDGISVGINAKYTTTLVPLVNEVQAINEGFAFDIGLLINFHALKLLEFPEPNMSIGVAFQNTGLTLTNEFMLGVLEVGIAYTPIQYVNVAFDIGLPFNRLDSAPINEILQYAIGIGVFPVDFLEITGGAHLSATKLAFSAGIGLQIGGAVIRFVQHIDLNTNFGRFDNFSVSIALKTLNTIAPERRLAVQKLYLVSLQEFTQKNFDEALRIINSALAISPNYQPAIGLKKQIQAIVKANKLLGVEN